MIIGNTSNSIWLGVKKPDIDNAFTVSLFTMQVWAINTDVPTVVRSWSLLPSSVSSFGLVLILGFHDDFFVGWMEAISLAVEVSRVVDENDVNSVVTDGFMEIGCVDRTSDDELNELSSNAVTLL